MTMSSSPNPRASSPRPSGWGTTRTSAAREAAEGLMQGAAVPNVGLKGAEKEQLESLCWCSLASTSRSPVPVPPRTSPSGTRSPPPCFRRSSRAGRRRRLRSCGTESRGLATYQTTKSNSGDDGRRRTAWCI
ncbi:hypothetical protein FIBSPDRAFT_156177 [Athelia psychrophila]|uniref:Uncharacterized protein n=1 Tax=Athelia psychrophila TaxID=1759441 RepID=A0A166BC81_9AGAM|nr:hypothetical protein FIBSPDRAFT_156177 [Fibularhizoctonia sp. CBS 109695]